MLLSVNAHETLKLIRSDLAAYLRFEDSLGALFYIVDPLHVFFYSSTGFNFFVYGRFLLP